LKVAGLEEKRKSKRGKEVAILLKGKEKECAKAFLGKNRNDT